MSPSSKTKFKKPKNRKNKINLVFDEEKRREFLTGFHKRKLQRKKKAKEKLEVQLKEERKRLKNEAKESYKKLVVSNRTIPELEHLFQEEYEDDDVTVKISELSTNEIAKQNNWIGTNTPKYCENEENESSAESAEESEKVPGMELKSKKDAKLDIKTQQFNTKKEIKKVLKKTATKNVQKSVIFKKKNKLERQKQIKKSLQQKREKIKNHRKLDKRRGYKKRH